MRSAIVLTLYVGVDSLIYSGFCWKILNLSRKPFNDKSIGH